MGKLLRVLIFVILIVGLASLVFAWLNFGKREVLIGRAHALEEMFIKLARTLEAGDPPEVPQPLFPQRDISPVTSRELDNPERSAFWESYNYKYEPPAQPLPTLDFSTREKRLQLRQYYRIDPATGKPVIDELTGRPLTTGPGTMAELLEEAFARAQAQYALLNKTRAELPKLREELINTIEELNDIKKEARTLKKTIEERDAAIARLEGDIRTLNAQIAALEEEKKTLNVDLAEARNEIAKLDEDNKKLADLVKVRDQQIADLKRAGPPPPPEAGLPMDQWEGKFTPGEWGKVVSCDEHWKFAIVEFEDAVMDELLGPDRGRMMPPLEMMVRRPGFEGVAGDFVTRLRLRMVIRDQNLVIADILTDWQQVPLEPGDVVYF